MYHSNRRRTTVASLSRTIREQITDLIRDDVVAGNLSAGEPLRETEIAERFGVSRGPVRDAFLQLAQEGFLAYQANRGVTVRVPPESKNRDFIVSLRQQIEGFVIRGGIGDLSDEQFAKIESTLVELKAACETQDVASVARCDIAFHQTILEACGGKDLLPIWKWLCSQMLLLYSRLDDFSAIYAEHETIMQALRSRSKQATVSAIKANIR